MPENNRPIRYLDHFVFKYCKEQLINAKPEDICQFYIEKFVFKNHEYLQQLIDLYKLPSDMLKMHTRITKLAELRYEGEI